MSETEEYRHPYQSAIDEYHKNVNQKNQNNMNTEENVTPREVENSHLGSIHAKANEKSDEQLGEVPEVLPTELGGHPVITEDVVEENVDEKEDTNVEKKSEDSSVG